MRCAMRHRRSGLHSFRSIVASEWLLRGRATYIVELTTLRSPSAFGIGCVSPAANVNSDTAWAPGPPAWQNGDGQNFGFCWEGREEDSPHHEIRALDEPGQTLSFAGEPCLAVGRTVDDADEVWLQQGDTLRATLDVDRQSLGVVVLRPGHAQPVASLWTESREHAGETLRLESASTTATMALTIALKFAGDGVRITRALTADDGDTRDRDTMGDAVAI